eukprot:TRINITY_DN3339_c0_g1_i1.p1 TRINITY_DN3339_c0_g1~~TRINITY_DN3339_c0_g1_i1.p1  ORF type:complete len:1242 (+),score=226.99 TRINITY_DN3339_c0_g1_i1:43-3768(+)
MSKISFGAITKIDSCDLRDFQDDTTEEQGMKAVPFSSYKLADTSYITLALAVRSPPTSWNAESSIVNLSESNIKIKSPGPGRERNFPFHFLYDMIGIEQEEDSDDVIDLYDDIGGSLVDHFLDGNPCGVVLHGSADSRKTFGLCDLDMKNSKPFLKKFSDDLFKKMDILSSQTNGEIYQKVEICSYACMGNRFRDLLNKDENYASLDGVSELDGEFEVTFAEVQSVSDVEARVRSALLAHAKSTTTHFVLTFNLYFKSGLVSSCHFVELASGHNHLHPSKDSSAILASTSTFLHCIHERSHEMSSEHFIGQEDLLSRTVRSLFLKNSVAVLLGVICPRPEDYYESIGTLLTTSWAAGCLKREPPISIPWLYAYDCDASLIGRFLDEGGDVNIQDFFQQTLLMWTTASLSEIPASVKKDEVLVDEQQLKVKEKNALLVAKYLIEKGADVNLSSKANMTALHISAALGSIDICKSLIASKASLEEVALKSSLRSFIIEDEITGTPLHFAVNKSRADIASLLLESGSNVNEKDEFGSTPLAIAIAHGNHSIFKLLCTSKADISLTDGEGNTALIEACKYGRLDMIKDILADASSRTDLSFLKTYVNAPNEKGANSLHIAVREGHEDVVQYLLNNSPIDINRPAGEYFSGNTPLHLAASNGSGSGLVEMLLSFGATLDITNDDMETPLVLSVDAGDVEIASILLKKGAAVTSCNKDGAIPIMIACRQGNIPLVELLLSNGVDVDSCKEVPLNEGAIAALTNGSKQGPLDVRLDPNCGLLSAAMEGHEEVIHLLLDKYKANPVMTDIFGNHVLHYLSRGCYLSLLEQYLDTEKASQDSRVQQLLQLVDSPNELGETPIFAAVAAGSMEVIEFFITHDADLLRRNHRGKSLLHFAAANGKDDVVSFLLEKGLKVDCEDDERNTPLLVAAHFMQGETVMLLLESGANPNHQNVYKLALLHYSAQYGWISPVEQILAKGGDVNISDRRGRTALHYAGSHRRDQIFRMLIEGNANVNVQDDKGYSPLHICVMEANEEIVSWMVKRGAHLNLVNFKSQTPLHLAALQREKEERLKPNDNERLRKFTRIMFSLVEQGAVLDIPDVNGQSVASMLPGNVLDNLKERSEKGRERRQSVNLVRKIDLTGSPSLRDVTYNVHQMQMQRGSTSAAPSTIPEQAESANAGDKAQPKVESSTKMGTSSQKPNENTTAKGAPSTQAKRESNSSQNQAAPRASAGLEIQTQSRITRLCLLY